MEKNQDCLTRLIAVRNKMNIVIDLTVEELLKDFNDVIEAKRVIKQLKWVIYDDTGRWMLSEIDKKLDCQHCTSSPQN